MIQDNGSGDASAFEAKLKEIAAKIAFTQFGKKSYFHNEFEVAIMKAAWNTAISSKQAAVTSSKSFDEWIKSPRPTSLTEFVDNPRQLLWDAWQAAFAAGRAPLEDKIKELEYIIESRVVLENEAYEKGRATIVLPERKEVSGVQQNLGILYTGFNLCLDEIARLNKLESG